MSRLRAAISGAAVAAVFLAGCSAHDPAEPQEVERAVSSLGVITGNPEMKRAAVLFADFDIARENLPDGISDDIFADPADQDTVATGDAEQATGPLGTGQETEDPDDPEAPEPDPVTLPESPASLARVLMPFLSESAPSWEQRILDPDSISFAATLPSRRSALAPGLLLIRTVQDFDSIVRGFEGLGATAADGVIRSSTSQGAEFPYIADLGDDLILLTDDLDEARRGADGVSARSTETGRRLALLPGVLRIARVDGHGCLGTYGFWQGLDLEGGIQIDDGSVRQVLPGPGYEVAVRSDSSRYLRPDGTADVTFVAPNDPGEALRFVCKGAPEAG